MKNSGYYNTNKEQGEVLEHSNQTAKSQEEKILSFLENHSGKYSPEEIQKIVLPDSVLTSIRRALTNLTKQGKIQKTDFMKEGGYGKKVHTWQRIIKTKEGQTQMF